MIDLDELMRLHDAATPGPWKMKSGDFESEDGYGTVTAPYVEADGKMICVPFDKGPDDDNDENDAAYIVAACNAVPDLVARIRELEEQLDVNEIRMKKSGDVLTNMLKAMHKITDKKEDQEVVPFKQFSALEPCRIVSNNNSTPLPEPDSFAERMRAWRLEHGRTFRELSTETGILPSVLSGIEAGRREPTEEQRKKIEEVMRCSN